MQAIQFLVALLICISAASASSIVAGDESTPAVRMEIINHINSLKTTWKAAVPVKFANATVADVKRLLGTILPEDPTYVPPAEYKTEFKTAVTSLPSDFDLRTAYPQCASIVGHVRDQSNCGSCWAFGSTEAFNDRYCIKTGDNKTLFSPEDTVSCCTGPVCSFSMGCNGGQPSGAWNWFTKNGVSTGGDYSDVGTGSTCKPYSMQSCAHHVDPPAGMVSCTEVNSYKTPKCTSSCNEASYPVPYSKDKHYASASYGIRSVANLQQELMEKGTISVSMTVYEDFEAYSSGIYQHKTGSNLGGHAIKLVGWGVDNGVPYWTCINSWNESWGEKGAFRILRGSNECGIENGAVAGDV